MDNNYIIIFTLIMALSIIISISTKIIIDKQNELISNNNINNQNYSKNFKLIVENQEKIKHFLNSYKIENLDSFQKLTTENEDMFNKIKEFNNSSNMEILSLIKSYNEKNTSDIFESFKQLNSQNDEIVNKILQSNELNKIQLLDSLKNYFNINANQNNEIEQLLVLKFNIFEKTCELLNAENAKNTDITINKINIVKKDIIEHVNNNNNDIKGKLEYLLKEEEIV